VTTIYVNGKRVTQEEIRKIEIHSETIKRIFLEKMANSIGEIKNDRRK